MKTVLFVLALLIAFASALNINPARILSTVSIKDCELVNLDGSYNLHLYATQDIFVTFSSDLITYSYGDCEGYVSS